MPAQLMTIEEVAAALAVGHKSVRAAIAKSKLLACKIGNEWRIAPEHLNDYLAARSTSPTKAIYSIQKT